MGLADRLAKAGGMDVSQLPPKVKPSTSSSEQASTVQAAPPAPATPAPKPAGTRAARPAAPVTEALSPVDQMKKRATEILLQRLGNRMNDSSITDEELAGYVRDELSEILDNEDLVLSAEEKRRVLKEIEDDALGLGPLQPILEDPTVTEIMVNGPKRIYIEKSGRLQLSDKVFTSEAQLRTVIDRIVSRVGRRVDESSPMVDARLQDGSRVNAIIPPLSPKGSSLTIRKFSADPLQVEDLIRFGSFTPEIAEVLRAAVEAKLNILVSGGTGTGKTTLLNVLSSFIPAEDRIVTVEDAIELSLQQDHVVQLETRPPNVEGTGEITIRDLVKNSLRMRPDRIVVGECRAGEALDMLQAMNTGHDGSLSTLHSNSPRDCIARLETLVLMAGVDLPLKAIRDQISSAVDMVVQIQRLRDGTRRITHITEVLGMEGDVVTLQDVFKFDFDAGVDETGRFRGTQTATGIRPRFTDKLLDYGIPLDFSVFDR